LSEHERGFEVFGTHVRLLATEASHGRTRPLLEMLERRMHEMHACLTRFDPDSELSRLNGDARPRVPVSATLERAVKGALWAARRSDGLVDPTLLGEIVRAGYGESRAGTAGAGIETAIREAPARRPARPAPAAAWRRVSAGGGHVARPPGAALDLGGSAKGMAADISAAALAGHPAWAADIGGDLRIGGTAGVIRLVEVEHPLGGVAHGLPVRESGVATSGIGRRLWHGEGGFAHHLLDPATGGPAWTGLIQATALAPTALEAETLAKVALLSGAAGGRRVLQSHGGVLVHEDGDVEVVGDAAAPAAVAA
jgi:thiamine biosynthesis lipoprotein